MADMPGKRYPLDGNRPGMRALLMALGALATLVCLAAAALAVWLIAGDLQSGDWLSALFPLLCLAGAAWMTGCFLLWGERMLTEIEVTQEGLHVKRPLQSPGWIPWDALQTACICFLAHKPGLQEKATVLCFVMKGEKKNLFDRWKTENPWHYRRLIVADYSEELQGEVSNYRPVEDLRGTPAYPMN